jgi:hypothetical protein
MPRPENFASYLDSVTASAASRARVAKANHARVDAASRAGTLTTRNAGIGAPSHARLGTANYPETAKADHVKADRAGEGTAAGAEVAKASRADMSTASYAAVGAPTDAKVGASGHAGVGAPNDAEVSTGIHAGVPETSHAEVSTAGVAIQRDTRPAPEVSRQIDQFGPLPIRVPPSSERKARRDRRRLGAGEGRAITLRWPIAFVLAAGLAWALTAAFAQQQPANPKPVAAAPAKSAPARPPSKQQSQQAQQQQPAAPPVSTEQTLYLIRSTLLTLNDANRSGNYTVLRDLGAPDFQARNTAADLSQSFSNLRRRNFDLYGAALLAPQLTAVPALDQRGFLHLTGFFPTRPQQIDFDLLFQDVGNQWRLFGIAINTPQASTAER